MITSINNIIILHHPSTPFIDFRISTNGWMRIYVIFSVHAFKRIKAKMKKERDDLQQTCTNTK